MSSNFTPSKLSATSLPPMGFLAPFVEYAVDAAQRSVLFWDTLRQRGNQYREHLSETAPHVLNYKVELVMDGRTLERPVNYLLARVLAYCLEYAEGITFSKGLSAPEDPPLSVRDLTGRIQSWIEIGTPDAERLHRAGKAAERVVVYAHRDPTQALRGWSQARIHRAADLEIYRFDRAMIEALMEKLDRRMAFAVAVHDRELYLSLNDGSIQGVVSRVLLTGPAA